MKCSTYLCYEDGDYNHLFLPAKFGNVLEDKWFCETHWKILEGLVGSEFLDNEPDYCDLIMKILKKYNYHTTGGLLGIYPSYTNGFADACIYLGEIKNHPNLEECEE